MLPSELVRGLRRASRVAVLTGAGISAESGVPTFRDAQTGLWSKYSPEDLATPEAFSRNPRLVWEWYAQRRERVSQVRPNPGHLALAEMEKHFPGGFTLITQNVDSLHQRAGSCNVIELHGNLARVKCSQDGSVVENWESSDEVPPRCPRCGGLLRPDVVWFGEMLPQENLHRAVQAVEACQAFFSIGTSSLVQPAASLAYLAKKAGAVLVEINPEGTPLTSLVDYALTGPAGVVLPEFVKETWG